MNGSSSEKALPVRNNNKKKSFDDGSGLSWKPGYPAAKAHKNPLVKGVFFEVALTFLLIFHFLSLRLIFSNVIFLGKMYTLRCPCF